VIKPSKYLHIAIAALIAFSSVRVSVPLLRYMWNYSEYTYQCQRVRFHTDHHHGECELEKDLAREGHSPRTSEVVNHKFHFSVDLWFEANMCKDDRNASEIRKVYLTEDLLYPSFSVLIPPPKA
jgi:hypothetical protein